MVFPSHSHDNSNNKHLIFAHFYHTIMSKLSKCFALSVVVYNSLVIFLYGFPLDAFKNVLNINIYNVVYRMTCVYVYNSVSISKGIHFLCGFSLFLFCRRMRYSKKEYVKEYVKKQQWIATATSSLLSYVCESFYNFSSIWQNSMDMFTIPETYGNFERWICVFSWWIQSCFGINDVRFRMGEKKKIYWKNLKNNLMWEEKGEKKT